MTGRIITVRHGRPALSRRVFLSAKGYGDWWQRYDESGLDAGATPPEALRQLGHTASAILSSTMPRAVETARLIAPPTMRVQSDALYIEAPLPVPPWPEWIKLSPRWWGVISRSHWTFGYAPDGMETRAQTWERVDCIIDNLASHAKAGDVILCAHGYLNWMIAKRMNQHGWVLEERHGGNKYWSRRVYKKVD